MLWETVKSILRCAGRWGPFLFEGQKSSGGLAGEELG